MTLINKGPQAWEIASFDGMQVTIRTGNEGRDALLVLRAEEEDFEYCMGLDGFWSGQPAASDAVRKLRRWFELFVPGTGKPPRSVQIMVKDQIEHACHGMPLERVPSPAEIFALCRKSEVQPIQSKSKEPYEYYAIKSARTLPDLGVEVCFANGDVRVVGLESLNWNDYWLSMINDRYHDLVVHPLYIAWKYPDEHMPDGFNTYEIESACLWGMGRLVRHTSPWFTYRAAPALVLDINAYPSQPFFRIDKNGHENPIHMNKEDMREK
jgi:hypothetical protein